MSGSQPGNWKNRVLVMRVNEAFIVYILLRCRKKKEDVLACKYSRISPLPAGRDVFSPAKPSSLTSGCKTRLLNAHAKNFALVD